MNIDIRTLTMTMGILNILQVVVFIRQYMISKPYRGTGWWLLWSIFVALGFGAILLRDIPTIERLSILLANTLLLAGHIFLYIGTLRFLGKRENRNVILIIFGVFFLATIYVVYLNWDHAARIMILYIASSIFSLMTAYALLKYKTRLITTSAIFLAVISILYGVYFIFRSLAAPTIFPIESIFTPALIQVLSFLVTMVADFLWTVGLIMMVNQRSNEEMNEVKERFELIFNTEPDAILITRQRDNRIVEMNDGFEAMSGYSRAETIGKTSTELNIWSSAEDRQKMIDKLQATGVVENLEGVFQRKDGEQFFGMMSVKAIYLHGEPHYISVTRNITERRIAEETLRRSEEKFRLMVENSQDIIYTLDGEGIFRFVSPVWTTLLGHSVEDVLGKSFKEFVHPDDIPACMVFLYSVISSGKRQQGVEYRIQHLDGTWYWHMSNAVPIRGENDAVMGFYGIARDISERKRAEKELRESERRYRLLADHAHDVIWTMTMDGKLTYISPSVQQMRGFSAEEVLQQSLDQIFCPASLIAVQNAFGVFKSGEESINFIAEQPCKNGSTVWTESTARLMCDENGEPFEVVGVSRDITERKRLQEELQVQATTDELIGIPNRRYFLKLAQAELKRAIRLNHPLAIGLMDIDYFKQINDTYGHAVGDQMLVTFAKICQKQIREIDVFARFGGDEFVILLPEVNCEQAYRVMERIRGMLSEEMMAVDSASVFITISCGIASLQGEHESLDTLIGRADKALYQAKNTGRNRICVEEILG